MSKKILIAGAGSIGTRHIKNLLKLGQKKIAVCDPDKKKLEQISQLGSFNLYKNFKIALNTEKPGIVFVCNPTHFHIPTASLALDYDIDLFIEKPLSHNLEGVDSLIRKANARRRIVMVACNYRFHPGLKKLKEILTKKSFGRALFSRIVIGYHLPMARKDTNYKKNYAAGAKSGGVLLDSGSHAVDYLLDFFGSVKTVKVFKKSFNLLNIKKEEMAILLLDHENGVLSETSMDFVSRKPVHKIEVITEKGSLLLDVRENILLFENNTESKQVYRKKYDLNDMFLEEIGHFLNSTKTRSKPLQDLKMAKKVLNVLLKNG